MKFKSIIFVAVLVWFIQNASAFYTPSTGRWLSRDPVQEHGGPNIYGFYKNNLIKYVDRLGLQGTFYPPDSEPTPPSPTTPVPTPPPGGPFPGPGPMPHPHPTPRPPFPPPPDSCDLFDEWYKNELLDMSWMDGIPNCPCSISVTKVCTYVPKGDRDIRVEKTILQVSSDANAGWSLDIDLLVHPPAEWCIRSGPNPRGAGQQCCYDSNGKLITGGTGAGTTDRSTSLMSHFVHDWLPAYWASQCDSKNGGNACIDKYLAVRPINNGNKCAKNEP